MTRDLFGFDASPAEGSGEVSVALIFHDASPKAWLLSETGRDVDAQWAPKSQVKRGEGRDENVWTMPRWIAADRGWT